MFSYTYRACGSGAALQVQLVTQVPAGRMQMFDCAWHGSVYLHESQDDSTCSNALSSRKRWQRFCLNSLIVDQNFTTVFIISVVWKVSRALPESARTHSSQQFHTLLFVSPVPCAQHAGFAGGDSWEAYLENRRAVAALWHLAVFTHCFSCSHNAYQCFTWEREKIRPSFYMNCSNPSRESSACRA